nr:hypothetical protein Iba_chr01dCG10800 [Ipomoea batatas]
MLLSSRVPFRFLLSEISPSQTYHVDASNDPILHKVCSFLRSNLHCVSLSQIFCSRYCRE